MTMIIVCVHELAQPLFTYLLVFFSLFCLLVYLFIYLFIYFAGVEAADSFLAAVGQVTGSPVAFSVGDISD